jgi:myo-inositol-1(or 4)-monophosphatase
MLKVKIAMSKITEKELKKIEKVAVKAVMLAGESLLANAQKISTLTLTFKEGQGVASSADLQSEKIIFDYIGKYFPHHQFLSEEANSNVDFSAYAKIFKKGFHWIIDPLDGTNNFLNGFDHYCISAALCLDGVTIFGIVYAPASGEMYMAIKGQGMRYKKSIDQKTYLRTWPDKNRKKIEECLFVADLSSFRKTPDQYREKFHKLHYLSRGVRRLGSATLDMCLVARGIMDCFWQFYLFPWDQAAATLICQEAGVKVTDVFGQKIAPLSTSVLAAREPLFRKVSDILKN